MARKTKDQIKEELNDIRIEFDEEAKYNDLAELLKPFKVFSKLIIQAALDAGFVHNQIQKFKDEESLKAAVIRHKPGLAARFIERAEVKSREVVMIDKECEFGVSILAGFGPIADHMRKESLEIERKIRREGISVHNIQSMVIERNMVASEDGRKHSKVTIKYRKEK